MNNINAIFDILTHEYNSIKKDNADKGASSNPAIDIYKACEFTKEQFKDVKDLGIVKYTGTHAIICVIDYNGNHSGDITLDL